MNDSSLLGIVVVVEGGLRYTVGWQSMRYCDLGYLYLGMKMEKCVCAHVREREKEKKIIVVVVGDESLVA